MEEVVLLVMHHQEEAGDHRLFQVYHRKADKIYDHPVGARREAAFARLHLALFNHLGFGKAVERAMEEFPEVKAAVEEILVGMALVSSEEGADLGRGGKGLGIKLQPWRFLDADGLETFLRYELAHMVDLLDPGFGYTKGDPFAGISPVQERIIRERYQFFWNLSIDGRLARKGQVAEEKRQSRYREFEALFPGLPLLQRQAMFEGLWQEERPSHEAILDRAMHPAKLLRGGGEVPSASWQQTPFPGSPCPLCSFPTHTWAAGVSQEVARLIQDDFPDWRLEGGACERCVEGYASRMVCHQGVHRDEAHETA